MVDGVDGEKSWRNRDGEFVETRLPRSELLSLWNEGNGCFERVLARLKPEDLSRTVKIRGSDLDVAAALHRSLAHYTYHVGQLIIMRQRPVDTNQMTIKQLQTELQSLGIKAGDTLMVHTSIRSVGLDRASWDWLEVVSKVREARVEAIVSACTEP